MFAQSCVCGLYSVMMLILIMRAHRIQTILVLRVWDIVMMFHHVSTPDTIVLVSCVLDIGMVLLDHVCTPYTTILGSVITPPLTP